MALYGLKMQQYMELIQMKNGIFFYKCISCDILLLPITLQNAQQHQHIQTCKKQIMLYVDSLIPYLPWIKQQY